MLESTQLCKRFGELTALDDLNIEIKPGEIFCLLGANGAGKTTTIHLFLNFIKPTSGSAFVNGLDVTQHPAETKKYLAYIPEQVMLYNNLTGLENLQYFCALAGFNKYSPSDLHKILQRAGLPENHSNKRVSTYSKGMRQKVGIAIAIAKNAKALLLDEPTSGLDPKASNEFATLLTTLKSQGVAVLMATHDLFRARETGTRIGIMKHGRLLQILNSSNVSHIDLEKIYLQHMHD